MVCSCCVIMCTELSVDRTPDVSVVAVVVRSGGELANDERSTGCDANELDYLDPVVSNYRTQRRTKI